MSKPWGHSSSHFFKVILQSTLEDKKLMIPEKFVRKFGDELSAVATLRVPNGRVWRVGLKKDGRKIWFHENWNAFVKHHSICFGHFVVFEYIKHSTFDVLVFDTTACEIDYPTTQNEKHNSEEQDEIKNEDSVEILGTTTTNKKRTSSVKKKEPQCKKCKMEEKEEMDEPDGMNDEDDLVALLKEKGICITERHYLFSTEERERVIEIARFVKPMNPSFMAIVRPSKPNYYSPYAPAAFGNKYVSRSVKSAKLQDSCGREWPMKIYWRSGGSAGFYLTKGWSEFSEINGFYKDEHNISIMSNPLGPSSSHFFKVILQSTLEDKKLMIPEKFVRKFGDELSAVAKLRVPNGRVWRVGLKKDGGKIWFHENWNAFVKYHSICFGHFVVFEYIKHSTFDVLVFDTTACEIDYPPTQNDKHNSEEQDEIKNENSAEILGSTTANKKRTSPVKKKEPQSKKCKMEEDEEMDELDGVNDDDELVALLKEKGICITARHYLFSTEERERAIEIARFLKLKNPSFMAIVLPTKPNYRSMYAPATFANKYVSRSIQSAKLQDSCGREWPMKIYWRYSGSAGFYLTKGWNEFSEINGIREGDICVFELIRMEDVLLKVSVFHATID
ncbi:B3 domain-containing transcription factor VRN1-like [Melia azedarach]|uniref:B3 domain-containing transcription factor VRN1-like n=1 Tax=Melia azedarach TaxID=155640 RepID=A0ACC1XY92_MELAZ|nr:B3 domain-containing transcription factor VRN1-like [Melia azedarach]